MLGIKTPKKEHLKNDFKLLFAYKLTNKTTCRQLSFVTGFG